MMTKKELHAIFSKNIKKYRHRFNWSQATLAQKTGVSVNFISDMESGKKWASATTMLSIANAFDIQVYELLKPPGPFLDNLNSIIKEYTDSVHAALENTRRIFLQDSH